MRTFLRYSPFVLLAIHMLCEAFSFASSALFVVRLVADAGLCAWALGRHRIQRGIHRAIPLNALKS